MYSMMATTGWNYGFIALWGLHVLSVIAFFTGVLFLIVLAVKTFTPTQLKNWAIGLMIVGTIVCLFTIGVTGRPWMGFSYSGMNGTTMGMMRGQQMGQVMEQMMQKMQEHDAGKNDPAHMQMENMMQQLRQDGRQGDLLLNPSSSLQ